MRRNGFESIVIWSLLFIVFGPVVTTMFVESVDSITAQLLPYVSIAGGVLLVVLAVRMLFRR